ncbi:MAG: hypothetical protein KTR16_06780 [Acidiferrobacterales bacterium]|nr:hypothetical protein [Acidiferrobacterales bacterium]
MRNFTRLIFIILLGIFACQSALAEPEYKDAAETPVQLIQLAAPLDLAYAEISSMTWCDDETLLILPQYPEFAARGAKLDRQNRAQTPGYLYKLSKSQIFDYLDGTDRQPLTAQAIKLEENGIRRIIQNFDGYEAIGCDYNKIWLSIETNALFAKNNTYLVTANYAKDEVSIYPQSLTEIQSLSGKSNAGDEAVFIYDNKVVTIHEINKSSSANKAKANVFDPVNQEHSFLTFPTIPYRITDSSSLDANHRFWVINYLYQEDRKSWADTPDPLFKKFGKGATHQLEENVERMVELQLTDGDIKLSGRPPIQLKLSNQKGRNWEAIARLDNKGLLVATDKFPATLFGFIPIDDDL